VTNGALIVDKSPDWTSHDVVNKVRRILGERSIGHLGTLDPLATGVLPLLVGSSTRLARFYGQSDKVYEAVIQFGWSTDTYDAAGERTSDPVSVSLTRERFEQTLAAFRGVIQQLPPAYSAKKIAGVPAYELARKNQPVELAPVEVEVYELTLANLNGDRATIRVNCSAGTYIRSIAHDLGTILGCGAHIAELRRTRSGEFSIEEARTIEELESLKSEDRLSEAILPARELLPGFPEIVIDGATAAQIRNGRNFHTSPFRVRQGSRQVKAVTESGALLAIGEAVLPNVYHPVVVFA
jgi:tRNA pseudouridine55 synthase